MQAQSGSTPDEPVDHRGEHLALKSTQRRAFAHVQVVVEPAGGDSEVEILRQDLEDTRDYSPILTFVCPVQHFAYPSGSLRVYGKDASHALAPPFSRHIKREQRCWRHGVLWHEAQAVVSSK